MDAQQGPGHDLAVCCFLLLCSRAQIDAILGVLPEARQRQMRRLLTELSGLSASELAAQLGTLRQREFAEAIGGHGIAGNESWESMPPPLLRWLCSRELEANGRKDHQGEAGH